MSIHFECRFCGSIREIRIFISEIGINSEKLYYILRTNATSGFSYTLLFFHILNEFT